MKARTLVRIRRASQILFLLLFFLLLFESRLPQDLSLQAPQAASLDQDIRLAHPVGLFFQLDPLVALTSLLSGHRLIQGSLWALLVLLLTFFLGRVFCGFICPLGTIHHGVSRLRPALKGEPMIRANRRTPGRRFKYFLLLTVLLAAAAGLNLAGLVDPISLLFRSLALALLPGLGAGIRGLVGLATGSDIAVLNRLGYALEDLASPVFGYEYQAFQTAWFIGALFLLILFLNRLRPRFWCRYLCPLGALLGLCARVSLLRLEKREDRCTGCQGCTRACAGAASPIPGQAWDTAECLMCFSCFEACPEEALSFRFRRPAAWNRRPDVGRRAVLGSLLAGLSLPLLGSLDGRVHKVPDPRLIRPPGSLPEEDFLRLCQRCGLCMKVCPTNAIQPTLGEAGMAGFWTPHLIMVLGACEYTCTLCGSVCPTGAIAELSTREKIEGPVKIGSAYLDRGRCLPWSGNGPCIVCQEHCPTSPKAIYLREEVMPGPGGEQVRVQLPFVDLKACVGCGICENKCPVRGLPAIRVIGAGESRSLRNQILL